MAEPQPSKLMVRVRFPSPAPLLICSFAPEHARPAARTPRAAGTGRDHGPGLPRDERRGTLDGVPADPGKQVRVRVRGERHGAVPERLRDHGERHVGGQHQRRGAVPEVVEPHRSGRARSAMVAAERDRDHRGTQRGRAGRLLWGLRCAKVTRHGRTVAECGSSVEWGSMSVSGLPG